MQSLGKCMKFPEEIKIEWPYDPQYGFLVYIQRSKSLSWRDICIPMFNAVLFTIDSMLVKGYKLSVIIRIMTEDLVYYTRLQLIVL